MQIFACPTCQGRVYFHNLACSCGQALVFSPEDQRMHALTETNAAPDAKPETTACANRADIGCNWAAEADGLCRSCAMTQVVPDLREPANLPLWSHAELAKRWVLANLGRWGWFTHTDPGPRPVFHMLSEQTAAGGETITMGHADGEITINVTESSDAVLARRQEELGELYRTMTGHIRHEIAHFLFLRLSDLPDFLPAFRALFGDERADYGAALKAHYDAPKPPGKDHVTSYATAHPHEDWAETIAHLLHLVDLADSGAAAGLIPFAPIDAYADTETDAIVSRAIDLSIAVNHVNRALDLPDVYPFVLTDGVRGKFAFAHGWLRMPKGHASTG